MRQYRESSHNKERKPPSGRDSFPYDVEASNLAEDLEAAFEGAIKLLEQDHEDKTPPEIVKKVF